MKLSKINNEYLTDNDIDSIVYEDTKDDLKNAKYALIFGNSMLIDERVTKAVEIYKNKRCQKLIFMGGVNGVSNQDNSNISEAEKMKSKAISLGVNESDILFDDTSNNTFENVDNALKIIEQEEGNLTDLNNIIIVTSEFHLKRCYAILKNKLPSLNITLVAAKDGFTDRENWYLSDNSWNSGRSIVTYEAKLLIKYAKEDKIFDLDIQLEESKKNNI